MEQAERDIQAAIAASLVAPRVRKQIMRALHLAASEEKRREILHGCAQEKLAHAAATVEAARRHGMAVLSILSPAYPEQLRQIAEAPLALYVRCAAANLHFPARSIAVVGTRSASIGECQLATHFARELADSGVTVVSGLALGVDGAAHRGVLLSSRPEATIAVLAHGLDMVYPPSHTRLAESIIDAGGVVISEYPPGTEARKHHFLERNRIVAGLCQGVVVFQAGERSGSLVTARLAADYGRDVFVLAGSGDAPGHEGGRRLADEGALVISCAQEVLAEYGLANDQSVETASTCQQYSLEEFKRVFKVSKAELLAMELTKQVVRLPGGKVQVISLPSVKTIGG